MAPASRCSWTARAASPTSASALGEGLYAAEVDYLVRNEWAQTAEDILFRRSKLGLHLGERGRGAACRLARAQPARRGAAGRLQQRLKLVKAIGRERFRAEDEAP